MLDHVEGLHGALPWEIADNAQAVAAAMAGGLGVAFLPNTINMLPTMLGMPACSILSKMSAVYPHTRHTALIAAHGRILAVRVRRARPA